MSPRSIEVTWDPPVANVDDVTGYVISYDGVEGFADDGSETVDQSRTSTTINGLQEFVSYDITVQAVFGPISVLSTSLRIMTKSDGKLNDVLNKHHKYNAERVYVVNLETLNILYILFITLLYVITYFHKVKLIYNEMDHFLYCMFQSVHACVLP